MIRLLRTTSKHPAFTDLIVALDKEFLIRYPDNQQDFTTYNRIEAEARVVLAFESELVVGCGCFRTHTNSMIEIKRMYVVPNYRNQGIGKKILLQLEQWAVEQGFTKAILETGIHQPEAQAAYRQSGYQVIPNFPPYEAVALSICMEKHLKPEM